MNIPDKEVAVLLLVAIKYDVNALRVHGGGLARATSEEISNIVAKKLSCNSPFCHFTPEDVTITFEQFGNWDKINGYAAIVTVEADALPIPITDLKQRNEDIAEAIMALLRSKLRENSKVKFMIRLAPTVSTILTA